MKSASWSWPSATRNAASWPSSRPWSGQHAVELKHGIENLAVLDLAFARAKYAEALRASEPILHRASRP